ncbi:MAG: hypothetical protein QM302_10070 [Acidobacteriota bacterium]|nr:hypothetical protein [Acidobacteriota bacterium]
MNLPRKLSRVVSAVACCVLATCLSVGLVACANNDEQLIRASVTKTLDLFKDPTKEKLGDFVESSSVDVDQLQGYGIDVYEFFEHGLARFDYEVGEVRVSGDTAEVDLSLTNVDLDAVASAVADDMRSDLDSYVSLMAGENAQQEFMKVYFQKVYEALDASEETVTTEATLKLTKRNGEWEVDEDSMGEVISGVWGGVEP